MKTGRRLTIRTVLLVKVSALDLRLQKGVMGRGGLFLVVARQSLICEKRDRGFQDVALQHQDTGEQKAAWSSCHRNAN